MNLKRIVGTSTLAAGVGLAGLLGIGLGTANANPGQSCGQPNAPACAPNQPGNQPGNHGQQPTNAAPNDWQQRGIDRGRQDHQPFNYQGRQVTPVPAGNGDGWGFWFLGQWIRL